MGMWHISIPERRTHPLFFRYPLYRNSERNRSIQPAAPTTQRSLAIALQQPSTAVPAIAFAPRTPQPPFCKQSCTTFVQRNKNIILFRSRAKNECRTPANAASLQHFRKFSCSLQLCPRPAHIARFNVRARIKLTERILHTSEVADQLHGDFTGGGLFDLVHERASVEVLLLVEQRFAGTIAAPTGSGAILTANIGR